MNMIPIENIVVGKRLRQIRQESVDVLAQSIRDVGQMNPILVTPILDDEGQETGRFRLIAGNHRLEACKRLGMKEIAVTITTGSEMEMRLAEIDENLCRSELTHLELAEHLAERKLLYEMKYPETKNGGAPGMAGGGKKPRNEAVASFAQDTATKLGKTERCVQYAVRRVNNISQEIRDSIRDVASIADNTLELDALADMEESEQKAAVRAVLDGKVRSIREFVRQKEENTSPQATIPSRAHEDQDDTAETGETPVSSHDQIRTLNEECTTPKARIKELESRSSDLVPPTDSLIAEIEEWKRRALEAEEQCIYLEHQLDEINANPARQSDRGLALEAMLKDLKDNLEENPGEFYRETLDRFEDRFMDLVFLIKNVKRR